MRHSIFAAAAGLAIIGCVSSGATRPGAPAADPAEPRTVDLATEFLDTACAQPAGAEFAKAWLAYEDRHEPFFTAIYYASEQDRAERPTLAQELGPRRDEMCGHVRAFLITAPGTIEKLRGRVAALLGEAPRSPVYFAVALQWTDGRADTFDGRDILALNARHDTFARTSGLAATVAHELIHDAQSALTRGADQQLPPVARSLYREGGAVFGVQQLFPELGARALGLRPEQVERAEVVAPQAAAEILTVLRAAQPGVQQQQRFFRGGQADALFPPKMGYYLGNQIYQRVARSQGDAVAARIAPADFLAAAEGALTELSHQPTRGAPPRAEMSAIVQLRDAFLAKARSTGFTLRFVPEIREWTRPSMISWRQEARAVAVPRWEELNEAQRALLVQMAGDLAEGRRLFDVLFRWFLVPHELTHALQDNVASARVDHARGERQANDVAVAFLHETPELRRQLFAIAPTLVQAEARLPSLARFPDEEALNRYFNDHYDELGRDLPQYGAFQVHFMLDSFRRLDSLRCDEAMRQAMGEAEAGR